MYCWGLLDETAPSLFAYNKAILNTQKLLIKDMRKLLILVLKPESGKIMQITKYKGNNGIMKIQEKKL